MRSPISKPEPTTTIDRRGRAAAMAEGADRPRRPLEPLLSARELADILGVNPNYVYEQAADGRLPSYKIGGNRRFRASEVEEWLRGCRQPSIRHPLGALGRER